MSITYVQAIRQAQETLLEEDDRVYIYGQDIGNFGGPFKATKGLHESFPGRVKDAPISEDAMVGSAVGAAIGGMRPIVEMQFSDFSACAFNQIVNQAGTHFFRTEVPCPLVIRMPSGGNPGSGPFHCQSMESLYAHYPGLVIVTPATVNDAYTMLIDAVNIDDPVLFFEHKFLYGRLKADKLNRENALPIGKARLARVGKHATVVAYSAMLHDALQAADQLAEAGYEIEVIDLRSVRPLDTEAVLASVARTGRLLCVAESFPWGGANTEIITRVVSEGFHLLDAPPMRINSKDSPVPYHINLWKEHKPDIDNIVSALKKLVKF